MVTSGYLIGTTDYFWLHLVASHYVWFLLLVTTNTIVYYYKSWTCISSWQKIKLLPTNNYLFKAKNWNTRKKCGICLKLTIKTPGRLQWRRSAVFIVNFEHIYHLFLVFLLLTLNRWMFARLLCKKIVLRFTFSTDVCQ